MLTFAPTYTPLPPRNTTRPRLSAQSELHSQLFDKEQAMEVATAAAAASKVELAATQAALQEANATAEAATAAAAAANAELAIATAATTAAELASSESAAILAAATAAETSNGSGSRVDTEALTCWLWRWPRTTFCQTQHTPGGVHFSATAAGGWEMNGGPSNCRGNNGSCAGH